ncbi:hypothetical protein [Algoriphagus namhaensis]
MKAIQAQTINDEVLILPLDSCGLCVDQVLDDLAKSEKSISVILSGVQVTKERMEKAKSLLEKKNIQLIVDEDNKSKSFGLNAFSPILIDISSTNYNYVSLSPENSTDLLLD